MPSCGEIPVVIGSAQLPIDGLRGFWKFANNPPHTILCDRLSIIFARHLGRWKVETSHRCRSRGISENSAWLIAPIWDVGWSGSLLAKVASLPCLHVAFVLPKPVPSIVSLLAESMWA